MTKAKSDFREGDRSLTAAVLAPPLIWFGHFTIAYTLVPSACASGSRLILHALTVVALGLLLFSGAASMRFVKKFGVGQADTGDARHTRQRLMAMLALVFAVGFALLVVANEIPVLLLRDCA